MNYNDALMLVISDYRENLDEVTNDETTDEAIIEHIRETTPVEYVEDDGTELSEAYRVVISAGSEARTANLAYWGSADGHRTVEETVVTLLGDYAADYDIDAIAAELRSAMNDALPPSVTLHGDSFIGVFGVEVDYAGILDSIDVWDIAAKHEIAGTDN